MKFQTCRIKKTRVFFQVSNTDLTNELDGLRLASSVETRKALTEHQAKLDAYQTKVVALERQLNERSSECGPVLTKLLAVRPSLQLIYWNLAWNLYRFAVRGKQVFSKK